MWCDLFTKWDPIRDIKGLGLQGSGLEYAGLQALQDGEIGALGLPCFTTGLPSARVSIFVQALRRGEDFGLLASTAKLPGFRDSGIP